VKCSDATRDALFSTDLIGDELRIALAGVARSVLRVETRLLRLHRCCGIVGWPVSTACMRRRDKVAPGSSAL